jgi:surfactin synthase thioesterase subunit
MSAVAVLCFPPAGAGASFFHHWRSHGRDLTLLPVELPGRERRFAEPVPGDVGALVAELAPTLRREVAAARHVAVFGHSFGAILAYETARALRALSPDLDILLVPSGSPGPGTLRGARISDRDDASFLASVRAIAGYRHPALDDPELCELLLPVLRADVALHENYQVAHRVPMDIPVVAIRGTGDDVVSRRAATEWRDVTSGEFRLAEIPGGHMYLIESWRDVLDTIDRSCRVLEPGA